MNKKTFLLLILSILLIFTMTSCHKKKDLPTLSVGLQCNLKDNNNYYLEWRIKNCEDKEKVTFENGDIMNYTVRHIETNKTYSNIDSKNKSTIILKPGEEYIEKVPLDKFLEKGEYTVEFWAISKEGTSPKIKDNFIKK